MQPFILARHIPICFCSENAVWYSLSLGDRGGTVAKVLCYESEGRCFDSRWCHWNFSLTLSFRSHYGPGVGAAFNRNECQEHCLGVKAAGAQGWQSYHHPVPLSCNLGTFSWNPLSHSRPVTGLLYLCSLSLLLSINAYLCLPSLLKGLDYFFFLFVMFLLSRIKIHILLRLIVHCITNGDFFFFWRGGGLVHAM